MYTYTHIQTYTFLCDSLCRSRLYCCLLSRIETRLIGVTVPYILVLFCFRSRLTRTETRLAGVTIPYEQALVSLLK